MVGRTSKSAMKYDKNENEEKKAIKTSIGMISRGRNVIEAPLNNNNKSVYFIGFVQ